MTLNEQQKGLCCVYKQLCAFIMLDITFNENITVLLMCDCWMIFLMVHMSTAFINQLSVHIL